MVLTRRTAPTGADSEMPDPELALKKKPVRRATAKQTTKPDVKPRATRAKKPGTTIVEKEPEVAIEPTSKPRATRGRPKKVVEPTPASEEEQTSKPAAKATRATVAPTSRGRKAATAVKDTPELSAPAEPKPARRTRATAIKPAPLSPKKITQVSKPQCRDIKTASGKTATNVAQQKAPVRSRVATRKRTASDENADVPQLEPPAEGDEVVKLASMPIKKPGRSNKATKQQESAESEASMSSRASTPIESPPQSEQVGEEDPVEEPSEAISTPEKQVEEAANNGSDDELCGPKTPMRRSSPSGEARYHLSAQRTIRKYNEEQGMQTPARRYRALASPRGTPQTQKPYCRPAPPSSVVRPMTVQRGAGRAFVFKDLREGAPELHQRRQEPIVEEEAEEDVTFIPDDDIIPVDDQEEPVRHASRSAVAPIQPASPPASKSEVETDDDESAESTASASFQREQSVDNGLVDNTASDAGPDDPDATIITEDGLEAAEASSLDELDLGFLQAEDTVIMNEHEQVEMSGHVAPADDEDMEETVVHYDEESSTPETMIWENVQPEHIIEVNFDDHMNDVRTLPQTEETEVLDISSMLDNHMENCGEREEKCDALADAEERSGDDAQVEGDPLYREDFQGATTPTVNLNEYFDLAALAEPTQLLDFEPASVPMDSGDEMEIDVEVEDVVVSSAAGASTGSDTPGVTAGPDDMEASMLSATEATTVSHVPESTLDADNQPTTGSEEDPEDVDDEDEPIPAGELEEVRETVLEELTFTEDDETDVVIEEVDEQSKVPHFARPTFSSRRKSLPASSMRTPVKAATRPSTSDGASMPRVTVPFGQMWSSRSRAGSVAATPAATPRKGRESMGQATPTTGNFVSNTNAATPGTIPKERYPVFGPREDYVDHSQTVAPASRFQDISEKPATRRQTFHRAISGKVHEAQTSAKPSIPAKPASPVKQVSLTAQVTTPVAKPRERYPALGSRTGYIDQPQTTASPARSQDPDDKPATRRQTFHRAISGKARAPPSPVKPISPVKTATPVAKPRERYPALGPRAGYVEHAQTVAPPARFQDPENKRSNRRQTFHRAASGKMNVKDNAPSTPDTPAVAEVTPVPTPRPQETPAERFPLRRAESKYQDHANTVAAPRFQTPIKSPAKRPATTQKPMSLRKTALKANTPMKTPLKAAAMAPGQEPMTPHPSAPLRGVTALVEVFTLEGASASTPFVALLHRLGAKTTRVWGDKVTHVIFKDGSPTTLQRVRLHNKGVSTTGKGSPMFCVNSRWVTDCDTAGTRQDETDEEYAVDVEEVPRGGKRRRKSMEPSALMNLSGNVIRDRKSSLGRSSLGRLSMQFSDSPAKKMEVDDVVPGAEDKENSDDDPATPDWIAEPNKLVQQTAPMKRVRKLDLQRKESRRLTFWDGAN